MKNKFIETHYQGKLELPPEIIQKLPKRLVLAMPAQFLNFKEMIIQQLERAGKEVTLFRSRHGRYPGQILGCDVFSFPGKFDAFLYIGDGKFHPTALLYENNLPVYSYNPFTSRLEVIDQQFIDKVLQRRQGMLAKLLLSKTVGIINTTKPGQNRSKEAEILRKKLERSGKEVFMFLAEEINSLQLENFNFVDVWVNTGCPRIAEEFRCLNLKDLSNLDIV